MYKQNNRFPRRSEGNRIGKPLAGGKFHASRKSDVRNSDKLNEAKKAEKSAAPAVRRIMTFDDIKAQV